MILVGITGGIGSGKTTVANMFFKEYGIPVYIADDEAKKLMHGEAIRKEIKALFGPESYDEEGNLNRKFLADRVFNNKELLEQLNAIVHPRVESHFKEWVLQQTSPYILYEAAILFETGRYKELDYTILVTAPEKTRIARVMKRDGVTEEQVKARMKNQWSDNKKKKLSNWIIYNENIAKTARQVAKTHILISAL